MTAVPCVSTTTPTQFASSVDLRVLRYSRVWEDHRLLERGLEVTGDSDVLMIASAGCNVLNMLLHEPKTITAVDLSPAQNALCELLLTAIGRCSAVQVRRVLGVDPATPEERIATYASFRGELTVDTRALWDSRIDIIAEGLAFSGRLERYFTGFTREVLPAHIPLEALHELFTLDVQHDRQEWANRWLDDAPLEAVFRLWFARDKMAAEGRDPAQLAWVDGADVPGQLWERLRWACTAIPTRDNFYLQAFLLGTYGDVLPPYLTDEGHDRLQPLLARVRLHVGEIADHLAGKPAGTFSDAALSDIFEYLSPQETVDILTLVGAQLRRSGRVAFWNLFVQRAPDAAVTTLERLDQLSDDLWNQDRSWFYQAFHVAKVVG